MSKTINKNNIDNKFKAKLNFSNDKLFIMYEYMIKKIERRIGGYEIDFIVKYFLL